MPSSSTVLSKCFSSYFVLSKDNDVRDCVEDVKEELAQIGINAKEISTNEYISTNDDSPINILGRGESGIERALRGSGKSSKLKNDGKTGNDSGDVNVNLSADDRNEELMEDFEIEDITESKVVHKSEKTGEGGAAISNNNETNTLDEQRKKGSNSNMPLLFVGVGFLVVVLAIAMMIMRPTNSK